MTLGPYRQIPFPKILQGPAVTYRTTVIMEDGRLARPSLPTLPGTDGTIGRQGPSVRTGRLGTLVIYRFTVLMYGQTLSDPHRRCAIIEGSEGGHF